MTSHSFPEFVLWRGKFWRPGRQNPLGNIGYIELLPLIETPACPTVARCEEIVCPYDEHIRLVHLWLEERNAQQPPGAPIPVPSMVASPHVS